MASGGFRKRSNQRDGRLKTATMGATATITRKHGTAKSPATMIRIILRTKEYRMENERLSEVLFFSGNELRRDYIKGKQMIPRQL